MNCLIFTQKRDEDTKLNELLLFLVIISASILPSMYNLFLSPMESRLPMWAKVTTGLSGCMWMYFL